MKIFVLMGFILKSCYVLYILVYENKTISELTTNLSESQEYNIHICITFTYKQLFIKLHVSEFILNIKVHIKPGSK